MADLTIEQRLEALYPKTDAERAELIHLGMVLKNGMNEVDRMDRFTGTEKIKNVFETFFPMPDEREWVVSVCRRHPG